MTGDADERDAVLNVQASTRSGDTHGLGDLYQREVRSRILLAQGRPQQALRVIASVPAQLSLYAGETSSALVEPLVITVRAHLALGQLDLDRAALIQAQAGLRRPIDPLREAEVLWLLAQSTAPNLLGRAQGQSLRMQALALWAGLARRGEVYREHVLTPLELHE